MYRVVPFIVIFFGNTVTPSFCYGIVWNFSMLLINVIIYESSVDNILKIQTIL